MNAERIEIFPAVLLSAPGLHLASGVEAYMLQTVIQSALISGCTS